MTVFPERIDWVLRGRSFKVARMVDAIEHLMAQERGLEPYGDCEAIGKLLKAADESEWLRCQRAAGIKRKAPPSETTRRDVMKVFAERREPVRK